ncbi:uncharacterized protein LOC123529536 [Mercenaria mercenaria]|uniref:uncharacterized protein LOC123529536 n=1 Tax=Mercenaria mercenaria TaxID=6596 RepID=UPI001E1DF9B1|nr:uncharacterized protein LOC123529536 [Mercenaria mercenaria]
MIKKRQKLVQLANSCELGWRVVAEYETNPIARDSDDEKKMYKAEARAAKKVKSEKSKNRRGRAFPYRRQRQVPDTPSSSGVMQRNRRHGLCFTCGKPGHWKMECNQNSSGLRHTLKRKFEEAGVNIDNSDSVVDRMANHILSARADGTVTKYSSQIKYF